MINRVKSLFKFSNKKQQRTVRILSINGGGVRGIIPLMVLNEIEKTTKKRINQLFDVISGTSTGGIIALGLSLKQPAITAEELLNFYVCQSEWIFQRNMKDVSDMGAGILKTFYSSQMLEELLQDQLQTSVMSDSVPYLLVPAYDIRASNIKIFDSYEAKTLNNQDYYMVDVALATSAAPSLFPTQKVYKVNKTKDYRKLFQYQNQRKDMFEACIDGGIAINNPTLLAYARSKNNFPAANDFLMLSLGTGIPSIDINFERLSDAGVLKWGFQFPKLITQAPSKVTDEILKSLLKQDSLNYYQTHYFSYNPLLDQNLSSMDQTSRENIMGLQRVGANIIKKEDQFLKLCSLLQEQRPYANQEQGIVVVGENLGPSEIMLTFDDMGKQLEETQQYMDILQTESENKLKESENLQKQNKTLTYVNRILCVYLFISSYIFYTSIGE